MKWISLLLLLILLTAHPALSQAPDDKLIVPGERIGKWTLEMTIDDLLRINGPRRAIGGGANIFRVTDPDIVADFWVHRWDHLFLRAATIGRDSQKVVVLGMRSDEFKTDKGIGLGATRDAVETAYGKPTAVTQPVLDWWNAIYDEIGLSVGGPPSSVATFIRIFQPGTAKQLFKF